MKSKAMEKKNKSEQSTAAKQLNELEHADSVATILQAHVTWLKKNLVPFGMAFFT